jgi:hypothetical protein
MAIYRVVEKMKMMFYYLFRRTIYMKCFEFLMEVCLLGPRQKVRRHLVLLILRLKSSHDTSRVFIYLTILMADKLSSGLEPVWWVQPVGRTPNTWS